MKLFAASIYHPIDDIEHDKLNGILNIALTSILKSKKSSAVTMYTITWY